MSNGPIERLRDEALVLAFPRLSAHLIGPHEAGKSVPPGSYLHSARIWLALIALFRVQHSAIKKPSSSCNVSVLARYRMNAFSRTAVTKSSFFSFSK